MTDSSAPDARPSGGVVSSRLVIGETVPPRIVYAHPPGRDALDRMLASSLKRLRRVRRGLRK
ncbi:hypothetical protein [Streptomyces tirandamycinicus]|uniref:Uncharacterized protein n=1 Tax=Streptomyces tirandamycinicus TaxID=2174846 RepID=A0A2S1T1S5_9ACTN|nr:hypothetical protein [Streptomyces tirandamycinicus]AWI32625.1 hypothetical protein DDW44_30360 [Streptomyces tirandamycinicus]